MSYFEQSVPKRRAVEIPQPRPPYEQATPKRITERYTKAELIARVPPVRPAPPPRQRSPWSLWLMAIRQARNPKDKIQLVLLFIATHLKGLGDSVVASLQRPLDPKRQLRFILILMLVGLPLLFVVAFLVGRFL